jgi:hypothetical protein
MTAALLCASGALAEERLDHRGSVGLLIGSGLEGQEAVSGKLKDTGARVPVDLGTTWSIGDEGSELLAIGRAGYAGTATNWAAIAGYRSYFGKEEVKTFFDLDLALHFTQTFTLGPRLGFGVQYDPHPLWGLFLGAAAQFAGGNGYRFSGEVVGGIQLRTYLLE